MTGPGRWSSDPQDTGPLPDWEAADRVQEQISGRYARFYAPLAIASVVLAVLPPFADVVETIGDTSTVTEHYGTLFDMAATSAGGPAVLALMLSATIVVLLAIAALRTVRSRWLPTWLAGLSGVVVLMLISRPATSHPPLSDAGRADMAVASWVLAIGLLHAVHLTWANRDVRGRGA